MTSPNLTERQQKWFASVRAGLERDTGKTLPEWVEIARGCPESGHRARLRWLKDNHGLLQNRASQVLDEAFGSAMGWSAPERLTQAMWDTPGSKALLDAVAAAALALPETLQTARKSYAAWSRSVQFAALRPLKSGQAALGLALAPEADGRLQVRGSQPWSERLTSRLTLTFPSEVDGPVNTLLRAAWERS